MGRVFFYFTEADAGKRSGFPVFESRHETGHFRAYVSSYHVSIGVCTGNAGGIDSSENDCRRQATADLGRRFISGHDQLVSGKAGLSQRGFWWIF